MNWKSTSVLLLVGIACLVWLLTSVTPLVVEIGDSMWWSADLWVAWFLLTVFFAYLRSEGLVGKARSRDGGVQGSRTGLP
ncbi:hypothetical protein BH23GEM11_BH23GEM11_07250 [soil metagenome]